jgi:hypothetical protein
MKRHIGNELAEREEWLDHIPEEIDRAMTWLVQDHSRLLACEADFDRRVREFETTLAAKDAVIQQQRTELDKLRRRFAIRFGNAYRRLRARLAELLDL